MKSYMKHFIMHLDEANTKEGKKVISREFVKHGMLKSIPYKVFRGELDLESLSDLEIACLTVGIDKALKNDKKLFELLPLDLQKKFMNTKEVAEYNPIDYDPNNERESLKLSCINENYGNISTKSLYWFLYKTHIQEVEDRFNKDLYEFDMYEIEELMRGMDSAITTKRNILSFITLYFDWCVEEGLVIENILDNIDGQYRLLFIDNNELKQKYYISFEELYKNGMWLTSKEDSSILEMDLAIVLLVRSGVRVHELVKLKYSNIDFKTGILKFTSDVRKGKNREVEIKLKKFVLKLLQSTQVSDEEISGAGRAIQVIDDYIVKVSGNEYTEEKALKSVRKRMSKFKNVYRPINEHLLITSAKIDVLNSIKEDEERELVIADFKQTQERFGTSANTYQKLKFDYELF